MIDHIADSERETQKSEQSQNKETEESITQTKEQNSNSISELIVGYLQNATSSKLCLTQFTGNGWRESRRPTRFWPKSTEATRSNSKRPKRRRPLSTDNLTP